MTGFLRSYRALPPKKRAAAWFTVCVFMQKGISMISTPVFTRLLSKAEYGEYGAFNSWMDIVTIFVSLKLYAGVYTQGLIKFSGRRDEFASSLQGLSFVLILGWTLVYFLFRPFWNALFSLTTVQMLCMLVMIWATAAFNFWAAAQRVTLKYRALVAITAIVSIAKPLLGVLLVLHAEDKVTARIFGLALVELICYSGLFVAQLRKGKRFYSKQFWKYALLFNLPLVVHYLSTTVLNSADRLMIKAMVGADSTGIYSVSYQFSQMMTLVQVSLEQSIQPWLYEKMKQGQIQDAGRIIYPAFFVMSGITLVAMLLAPELMSIVAPPNYQEAIWVIPPVMISVCLTFAYTMFACFEFYFEKTKYISIATVIGAGLNILLNAIFIRYFGYMAAGYTTLVCYVFFAGFHYIFMRKICRKEFQGQYPYDTRIILGIFGALCLAGAISLVTYRYMWLRYTVLISLLVLMLWKRYQIIDALKNVIQARKIKL